MHRVGLVMALFALGCAESNHGTGAPGAGGAGAGGNGGASGAGVGGNVSLGGSAGKVACDNLLLAAESPGPDGAFGTGDDEIAHADRVHWGTEHVEWSLRTQGSGPDGDWGTEDDENGSLSVYAWSSDGKLTTSSSYEAAGDDDHWNTTDDVLFALATFEYASATDGTQVQALAGADHAIGTGDDSVAQWLALGFEPDPDGATPGAVRVTGMLYHQAAGDDGVWQSEDDPIAFAQRHVYPSSDTRKIFMANAAGPDGKWLTSDDVEYASIVSMCNPALGIGTDKFYSPGPDGDIDTPDDVLGSQWYYRFDGCGESHCPTIIR
jgi:hypothetical protein